jgi:hypothetical protein
MMLKCDLRIQARLRHELERVIFGINFAMTAPAFTFLNAQQT